MRFILPVIIAGLLQQYSYAQDYISIAKGSLLLGSSKNLGVDNVPSPYLVYGNLDEMETANATISYDYEIASEELSFEDYKKFDNTISSDNNFNGKIVGLTFSQVEAYVAFLNSQQSEYVYRIPTEAEWDFMAFNYTKGNLTVNGLFNGIPEWTNDWYAPFDKTLGTNPAGPVSGHTKVIKDYAYDKWQERYKNRSSLIPDASGIALDIKLGVRLVRTVSKVDLNYANYVSVSRVTPNGKIPMIASTFNERLASLSTPVQGAAMGDVNQKLMATSLDLGLMPYFRSVTSGVTGNGDLVAVYENLLDHVEDSKIVVNYKYFGEKSWNLPSILFENADFRENSPVILAENDGLGLYWLLHTSEKRWILHSTFDANTGEWSQVEVVSELISGTKSIASMVNYGGTLYLATAYGEESKFWSISNNEMKEVGTIKGARVQLTVHNEELIAVGVNEKKDDLSFYTSTDGKSWKESRSGLPVIGKGQGVAIASYNGQLVVAGDYKNTAGKAELIKEDGSYLAYGSANSWTFTNIKSNGFLINEEDYKLKDMSLGRPSIALGKNQLVVTTSNLMYNGSIHVGLDILEMRPQVATTSTFELKSNTVSNTYSVSEDGTIIKLTSTIAAPEGILSVDMQFKAGVIDKFHVMTVDSTLFAFVNPKDADHVTVRTYFQNGKSRTITDWKMVRLLCNGVAKYNSPSTGRPMYSYIYNDGVMLLPGKFKKMKMDPNAVKYVSPEARKKIKLK